MLAVDMAPASASHSPEMMRLRYFGLCPVGSLSCSYILYTIYTTCTAICGRGVLQNVSETAHYACTYFNVILLYQMLCRRATAG